MKTNVLHLIDTFEQGGTERQAIQLVRLLGESGRYRVSLACFENKGSLRGEVDRLGLGEIPEFPLRSFLDWNFITQLRRFARHLRQLDIKIVHTHGFYTNLFGMAGAALAGVAGRVASRRETEGFRTPLQKKVERQVTFRIAHAIVVNAGAIRNRLLAEGVPEDKVITIYNGLDMSRVAAKASYDEALEYFGLPREGRRFVTIVANTNHSVKDHPMFLRAARRVREVVPDAAFVVAGEGMLLDSYRALVASLGISADVFFIGRCARVGDLLKISEVCVLSSSAEGFSNSILEYMAAARPVVVTDVGGAREAVADGETGYIIAPGDDAGMSARIVELLSNPARARKMGECGRRVVAERFSCEAQLASTETLYAELLDKPVAARAIAKVREESVSRHQD